jgi:putative copper export protein
VELSSWEAAGIIAKALAYAFALTAAGGAMFIILFSRLLLGDERARIAKMSCGLALAAVAFTTVRIPIIAGALGGELSSLWDWSLLQFVVESSEGRAAAVRASGLVLILSLAGSSVVASAVAGAGTLLVAASFSVTGHALSLEQGVFPQVLVTIHVVGVSFWLGAFYPLRSVTYRTDFPSVAQIMQRFGNIALSVVGALLFTGLALLWTLLESPLVLFESDYGRVLAIKVLLVAGLLSLAAVNKFLLTPALMGGDVSALRRLRNSITTELALAGLILAVTATLTTVTGPPALE